MKTTKHIAIPTFVIAGLGVLALVVFDHSWHEQLAGILSELSAQAEVVLAKPLFHFAGKAVRVTFLLKTIAFLFFLNLIARMVQRGVEGGLERNSQIDLHRKYLVSRGVTVAIYAIGLFVGIRVEKIDLTTLAIVGGTLGVAMGVGLQGVMSNFVAGLVLLLGHSVRVGDRVELGDKSGNVVRLGLRSSSIRTDENVLIAFPNSEFTTKPFSNLTASGPQLRTSISVPVAYGSNQQDVIQLLLEIADSHPDVLKSPVPSVIVTELGTRAAMFSLRVWTRIAAGDFGLLQSDLNLAVMDRFRQANIETPGAQWDLRMSAVEVGLAPVCAAH